jgi:hypothetical protein
MKDCSFPTTSAISRRYMYGTMKRPSTTEIGAVRPGVWPATAGRPQQVFRPDRRRGAAPGCRAKTLPGGVEVNPGLPLKTTMTTREHGKLGGLWWLSVAFGGLRSIPGPSRRPLFVWFGYFAVPPRPCSTFEVQGRKFTFWSRKVTKSHVWSSLATSAAPPPLGFAPTVLSILCFSCRIRLRNPPLALFRMFGGHPGLAARRPPQTRKLS